MRISKSERTHTLTIYTCQAHNEDGARRAAPLGAGERLRTRRERKKAPRGKKRTQKSHPARPKPEGSHPVAVFQKGAMTRGLGGGAAEFPGQSFSALAGHGAKLGVLG